MLIKKENEKITYDAIGNQMIEQVVNVRENKTKRRTTQLEDGLFDDEMPDEYFNCSWKDTEPIQKEENELTRNDFFTMEYKDIQYLLYRQLLDISSSLSYIKEVLIKK